jgi:hypothetical protein
VLAICKRTFFKIIKELIIITNFTFHLNIYRLLNNLYLLIYMLPTIQFDEEPENIEEEEEENFIEEEQEEEEDEEIFIEPEPIKTKKPISDERRKKNIENLKKAREAKKAKQKPKPKKEKEIISVSNNHREMDNNSDDEILFIKEEIKKLKKEKELDQLKKELNKVKPRKPRAARKKKAVSEPTPLKVEEPSIILKNFGLYSNNLF